MTSSNNIRMCVVTRARKHKNELVKITRINNHWQVDKNNSLFGRSIYLDLNDASLSKFKKQQRRFKMSDDNFNEIINQLEEL